MKLVPKSLIDDALRMMDAMFKDIAATYPEHGWELDNKRLTRCVLDRGFRVLTLDLPALESQLLTGLESGRLVPVGFLAKRKSPGDLRPRWLHGLWSRIFDTKLMLKSDVDPNAIFFLRQVTLMFKKIQIECDASITRKVIDEYHSLDGSLRSPSLKWAEDSLDGNDNGPGLHFRDGLGSYLPLFPDDKPVETGKERVLISELQRNADRLVEALGRFGSLVYSDECYRADQGPGFRHGPGAVSGPVDKSYKYDFISWPEKLERLFPQRYCAFSSPENAHALSPYEYPSRLICVPKTQKGPRIIAAEPTEHQWCQQLMLRFFEDAFKRIFRGHFIDLRDQSKSHELVRRSSLDGRLCTVDLSSASDRLSCWVMERFFRKNRSVLLSLHSARSRYIVDKTDESAPVWTLLRKFASQGTAVTFPGQSLVFLTIALTASGWNGKMSDLPRFYDSVRVYGDDIIIPSHGYEKLCYLMDFLQLKVNCEKSFVNGRFRESCGFDAYMGYDVTPVKPLRIDSSTVTGRQSLIDVSNNLHNRGLWHSAKAVWDIYRRGHFSSKFLPVVSVASGVRGLTSFTGQSYEHLKLRWNKDLHRVEARVWSSNTISRRKQIDGKSNLLQFFAEAAGRRSVSYTSGRVGQAQTREGLRWEAVPHGTSVR